MITPDRLRRVERVVAAAGSRARSDANIRAVLVVGSYAYGRPTATSDVDLVVVAADREPLLQDDELLRGIAGDDAALLREEDWGPLRERRCRTADGLDVELGLTPLSWLATPVDPGTARVLRDGCRVVWDPDGRARAALASLDLAVRPWTSQHPTRSPGEQWLRFRGRGPTP